MPFRFVYAEGKFKEAAVATLLKYIFKKTFSTAQPWLKKQPEIQSLKEIKSSNLLRSNVPLEYSTMQTLCQSSWGKFPNYWSNVSLETYTLLKIPLL